MQEGGQEWQVEINVSLAMQWLAEVLKEHPGCLGNRSLQRQARNLIGQLEARLPARGT